MQTAVVEFKGDGLEVRLTLSAATVLQGFTRTRLKLEADKAGESDPDRLFLRSWLFPDLCAATVAAEGIPWPLDFETFLTLPDGLAMAWEAATYKLNPGWLPSGEGVPDPKAPAPASTGG